MAGAMFALIAGGILVALALGTELTDLPWGAVILGVIMGIFFLVVQRRRRRELDAMEDDPDPFENPSS